MCEIYLEFRAGVYELQFMDNEWDDIFWSSLIMIWDYLIIMITQTRYFNLESRIDIVVRFWNFLVNY